MGLSKKEKTFHRHSTWYANKPLPRTEKASTKAQDAPPGRPTKAGNKTGTPPAKALPADALAALKSLKTRFTQAEISRRLGVSDATVSSALSGKYIGNVDKLAERIRGELLNVTVACPILGQISTRICQDERAKPFSSTSPRAVQMWRACKTCVHNPQSIKGDQP